MLYAVLISFVILSIASCNFWEVYIDGNTMFYHLEIFESVTRLGERIIRDDPSKQDDKRPVKFVFKERWFRGMEGKMFWEKYAPGGKIGKSGSTYEFRDLGQSNAAIPFMCPLLDKFDLHIVVTLPVTSKIPNLTATCLIGYENNSKIAFVVHHAEAGANTAAILHWTNVYVASKARSVVAKTPRFFSPAGLIIPPVPPNCNAPPVFVVQGSLQDRRDIGELAHILSLPAGYNFTVKILCKKDLPFAALRTARVQHLRHLAFTPYHEKILGAAFMLPLISPTHESTANYFHGHPTSSVAYGVHYKLRFLGHAAVRDEYSLEMQPDVPGYWHNGTESGIHRAVGLALRDFKEYCNTAPSQRGSWSG
jgi:hypothetical protein